MSLLVVGSLALDTIETPTTLAEDTLGGSATYIAAAASFFVRPVNLVGVVGSDFPESAMEFLRTHGVDLAGLEIADGKTFRWHGRYHPDMNTRDSLATHLNVFETFSPKIPEQYRATPYVCLGNIAPSLQSDVLDGLHSPKFVVCDTMNFWIAGARFALEKVFARVDGVIINESEARELTGESNLIAAGKKIQAIGPSVVVIKRGEHGATLFVGEKIFSAPAYPLERITDPTGAGDSFAGGFMGYLAKTNDISFEALRRAVVYGSAIASFSVQGFGANALEKLTKEEIERRVATLRTISSW